MRTKATWLAVVVVAAIALAAALDALQGETVVQPAAETRAEPPTGPAATTPVPHAPATDAAFPGTLYYTDDSCELQALDLAAASPAEAPNWDECRFVLSPDGRRVSGAGSGWDPYSDPLIGRLYQAAGGTIQIATNGGPQGERIHGTAPAWRPDGSLTYFADGAVREWPSGEVVIGQRELRLAVATEELERPTAADVAVVEASWLGRERLAAIVGLETPNVAGLDTVAVFEGRRLLGAVGRVNEAEPLASLTTSPGGRFASALNGVSGELLLLDDRGSRLPTPGLPGVRAIAFSPDGRWAAAATDDGVRVFRPGSEEEASRLDLDARDLSWRGGDRSAALVQAADAERWLAGVGVTGRLVVTRPSVDGCRLRSLVLPGLDWAEPAPGPESPCRFNVDAEGSTLPEEQVPRPGGGAVARCGDLEGCTFAWTPGGRPTFVSGGELFAGRPGEPDELLVSRADLRTIFDRPSALEEIAWLDDERFWAVVRSAGAAGVALMTTDALVYSPWFAAPRIEGLEVSVTGMVGVRSDRGVALLDSGGRRRLTFTNGLGVTWAPDELVAAVSTPDEVLFVAPVTGEIVTVPLEVADLEWVSP